jgi:hypothetical protein
MKRQHIESLLGVRKERERRKNKANAGRRKELYEHNRQNPAWVESQKRRGRDNFQKCKEQIYAYRKQRRATDPQYRISSNLRTYIYQRVGKKNTTGQSRFRQIVGCSIAEFCQWLENHFEPWMGFHNYGTGPNCWEIDHTEPCDSFDLTDPEQVKVCFHFSNMKPMRSTDNRSKSNKRLALAIA